MRKEAADLVGWCTFSSSLRQAVLWTHVPGKYGAKKYFRHLAMFPLPACLRVVVAFSFFSQTVGLQSESAFLDPREMVMDVNKAPYPVSLGLKRDSVFDSLCPR